MATPNPSISKYGWTAVPRSFTTLLSESQTALPSTPAPAYTISSLPFPSSHLVTSIRAYASKELPIETFNHSMRVYYYGLAILNHAFPTWITESFLETYALTALFHDIGCTPKNLTSTLLSFEWYGGYLALAKLKDEGAPIEQAEAVAEAVIRHQDLGDVGTITRVGALVQLATVFDNMGINPQIISTQTIEEVVKAYPRKNWSHCFAATIRRENNLKPWAHTTVLGEEAFPVGVEGNALMEPYDALT